MITYERFTDRSRRVMQLSQQEAQRFNHSYVGTEHVLLGLLKEGNGVAANALKNLGADLRKIRVETEKLIQPASEPTQIGKLPYTSNVTKLCGNAIKVMDRLSHKYVGTEYLLLGLLEIEDSTAFKVLTALGINRYAVEAEVKLLLGEEPGEKEMPVFVASVGEKEPEEVENPEPLINNGTMTYDIKQAPYFMIKLTHSAVSVEYRAPTMEGVLALEAAYDKKMGEDCK